MILGASFRLSKNGHGLTAAAGNDNARSDNGLITDLFRFWLPSFRMAMIRHGCSSALAVPCLSHTEIITTTRGKGTRSVKTLAPDHAGRAPPSSSGSAASNASGRAALAIGRRAWTRHSSTPSPWLWWPAICHDWQKPPSFSHGSLVPPVFEKHQYYPSTPCDTGRVSRRRHLRSLSPGNLQPTSLEQQFKPEPLSTKLRVDKECT